jgi:DNA polymerase-1
MKGRNLNGQWDYYVNHVIPLQESVRKMQARGIPINTEVKRTHNIRMTKELGKIDEQIRQFARDRGFKFTDKFPNSNKQLGAFLFDELGLKPLPATRKRARRSVAQEALLSIYQKLRKKDEEYRQLLELLLHRSRIQTIKSRYTTFSTVTGRDGYSRIHPTIKVAGTKTFRYAVSDPAVQQWPEEVRHYVEAPPGYALVCVDYSQLEARLLAVLSNDTASLRVFADGGDVHTANTLDLFGWTPQVFASKEPKLRKGARGYAKGFLYGLSYGGDAGTMKTKAACPCPKCVHRVAPVANLTKTQKEEAAARWFKIHHRVLEWQAELCDGVKENHYYDSPFGVRRWVAKNWGSDLRREVLNIPMQTNAALLMNERQLELDKYDLPTILKHHDSFIELVREDDVDSAARTTKEVMEAPCAQLNDTVFPVDVQVGQNWGIASDDNPEGLKDYEC